jgi:hypothetical protein
LVQKLPAWFEFFFQGETARPRYGLTKNIRSFRPTRVAFHEFAAIWPWYSCSS